MTVRTFDVKAYLDAPVPGEIADWPANIQDRIFNAIERLERRENIVCTIFHSRCDKDYGEVAAQDRWYVHVIIHGHPRKVN